MAEQVPGQSGHPGGLKHAALLIVAVASGVVAVSAMAYMLSVDRTKRERPSLRRCPFSFRDPMQMIYIGSLVILSQAIGMALAGPPLTNDALLPLCFGTAGLAGRYLASRAFVRVSDAGEFNGEAD